MSDFVNRLVSLRGMRSKAAFARDLDIAPQVYQRYEDGRIPSPEILARIADRCKVSVDHLLGRVSPPVSVSESESAPPSMPASAARSSQLLREPRAEYIAAKDGVLCRYPADCDLAGKLASLEGQMGDLKGQMNDIRTLLLSLLAEERRRHTPPLATPDRKEKIG